VPAVHRHGGQCLSWLPMRHRRRLTHKVTRPGLRELGVSLADPDEGCELAVELKSTGRFPALPGADGRGDAADVADPSSRHGRR
jgi:hypothetical protein